MVWKLFCGLVIWEFKLYWISLGAEIVQWWYKMGMKLFWSAY
jgi:hypothetical protein